MCLFIFTHIGACCKECGRSLAACCRSLNPVALLLSLITCPISFCIVLVWGLGATLIKIIPGASYQECLMWKHYISVIKTGKKAYDGKSKKSCVDDCCDSCLAEVYCCGAPVMVVISIFYPVLLLLLLVFTAISFAFRGLCAGAIRKDLNLDAWWPGVRQVIVALDRETSMVSYDSERGMLCADGDDFHRQQELPGPRGSGTGPGMGAPPMQQYGAPQPQVMAHVGGPVAQVQPAYTPQQAYAPQHPQVAPQHAYVPTAVPVSQGYPAQQAQQQSAAASAATTASSFLGAMGKAAMSAAAAVEKEAQRQREAQTQQQHRR
eukprot:CAMPEP_0119088184 /NCGR_PEP_ID=MMETSP1178-20130426/144564_1 /TAXON_ID=33656 /ORGANISM="unid sp, Strain CCMP2000" /LENGTH=319 /DNA_ID=CAMNT_0007071449 /DNA_START=21 /DNA_END=980 /DNA_ORIENTATION=-